MRLDDKQYEEIKQIVSDTFVEYDVKSIPINAFEIAYKMGLKVVPYSSVASKKREACEMFTNDGFSVEFGNGDWVIYYNDSCNNYGRISQTVMHEIGHYALGHIESGDEEEAEASFFAKYALAPPPLIHRLYGMIGASISVDLIMKQFDISYTAAENALRYYQMWITYGNEAYTDYEIQILDQFDKQKYDKTSGLFI